MQKINIAESEIRQAFEGIVCPPEYKTAIRHDFLSGYLDFVVEQVLLNKIATNTVEAIQYLIQYELKNIKKKTHKVTLGDLERTSTNRELYKKIDSRRGVERTTQEKSDASRSFGVRGHDTIPKLFSGSLSFWLYKKTTKETPVMVQQELTFGAPGGELNFDVRQKLIDSVNYSQRLREGHIRKICALWEGIVKTMNHDMFPSNTKKYEELLKLLQIVFGEELNKVIKLGKKNDEAEYLLFLTVLTWATTVMYYQTIGTKILFKEVRLFPYHYDVSLGRLDALEVVLIDGVSPTRIQNETLKKLALHRYDSVGDLIYTLVQHFGRKLKLIIHDWKFAVGDGVNGFGKTLNIIHGKDVAAEPIPKHKNQMGRYLSAAMISYGVIAQEHIKDSVDIWQNTDLTISGELHYFFPDQKPIRYEVVMSNEEKQESFGKIAAGYANADYRRKFLNVSQSLLNLGLELAEHAKTPEIIGVQQVLPGLLENVATVEGIHQTGKISRFLQESRKIVWYDEFETVEQKGSYENGEPRLFLHLDRFIDAVGKGQILVGDNFDFATGGQVHCWMPDHGHTGKGTPSGGLTYKNGGHYKCFGNCGVFMHIALESVPENLEGRIQSVTKKFRIKSSKDIESFNVSDRHTEAMKTAQKIFQNQFLDSPGARYLEEKRKLNPELSMSIGAGYASMRSIEYMFDMDFTYEELIELGFIGLSFNLKEFGKHNGLINLLKSKGYSIDTMQRLKAKTVGKEIQMLPALPYLVLDNRLTYPLDINHRITSFYGRSVDPNCPKDFAHQKTAPKGIPQGGFNLTNAMEKAITKARKTNDTPMVLLTEAILDVDTMIQHGDLKEAGAFVGVNNHLLFEVLSLFPGSFVTALNWDPSCIVPVEKKGLNGEIIIKEVETLMAGQRNTQKFVDHLKGVNFDYPVYDFPRAFVKKFPDFNDLNAHWQKVSENYHKQKSVESQKLYLNPFDVFVNKERIL